MAATSPSSKLNESNSSHRIDAPNRRKTFAAAPSLLAVMPFALTHTPDRVLPHSGCVWVGQILFDLDGLFVHAIYGLDQMIDDQLAKVRAFVGHIEHLFEIKPLENGQKTLVVQPCK